MARSRKLIGVFVGFLLLLALPLAASAGAPPGVPKPTGPQRQLAKPVPMPDWMAANLAKKEAAAKARYQQMFGWSSNGVVPDNTSGGLAYNQQAQIQNDYCGPAAVAEALGARGYSESQGGAASYLGTDYYGETPWSGSSHEGMPGATGYPVPDTLNYLLQGTTNGFYVPVHVDYNPTTAQYSAFTYALTGDITDGYPLVGDAEEVPGGPHLVGHPTNEQIYHWFEIRGYSSSGSTTAYEDSVHGTGTMFWWSGNVPAYSNLSTDTIVQIVGDRGYVW